MPKPKLSAVPNVDAGPWVKAIESGRERLGQALGDVIREAREAQATQIEKGRTLATFDDAFAVCVGFGAALMRLVGEKEHAERLRSAGRKAAGEAAADEAEAPEDEDTGADAETTTEDETEG